jgi:hypothetical protein
MSAAHITFGPDGYIHCWLNKSQRIDEAWFPEIGSNLSPDLTFLSCVCPFFSCPIFFFIFPWKCLCTTKKIRVCECAKEDGRLLFATCSNSNGPLRRQGIYETSGDLPIQLLALYTTSNNVRVLCAGNSSLTCSMKT